MGTDGRFGSRLTRRRVLQGMGTSGVGIAAWSLVGCGDDDESGSSTGVQGGTPKKGGTLKLAVPGDPAGFDPHIVQSNTPFLSLILNRVAGRDDQANYTPQIAKSWEIPEPTRIVFKLNQGIKFHNRPPVNGRELTAEDVAFSFNRARERKAQFATNFKDVVGVEAADAQTVVVRLSNPSRLALHYLLTSLVVAKEQFELSTAFPFDKAATMVGTGPFIAESVTNGIGGRVVRNPAYFQGESLLDAAEFTNIKDAAALLAAYRTGQVDMGLPVYGPLIGDQRRQLASSNPDIKFDNDPQGYNHHFAWDIRKAPWSDLRVRQAFNLTLDRQQQIALNAAGDGYLAGPYSWKFLGKLALSEDDVKKRPGWGPKKDEDFTKAKQLLSAAGFPNGFTVDMDVTDFNPELNRDPGILAVDIFKKIGVTLKVGRTLDRAAHLDLPTKGDMNFGPRGIGGGNLIGSLRLQVYTGGARNYSGYSNKRLDQLIDQEIQELDDNKLQSISKEIQTIVLDELPMMISYWGVDGLPVQPWMKPDGWTILERFRDIHKWWKTNA